MFLAEIGARNCICIIVQAEAQVCPIRHWHGMSLRGMDVEIHMYIIPAAFPLACGSELQPRQFRTTNAIVFNQACRHQRKLLCHFTLVRAEARTHMWMRASGRMRGWIMHPPWFDCGPAAPRISCCSWLQFYYIAQGHPSDKILETISRGGV
jgi:hypothetical protein